MNLKEWRKSEGYSMQQVAKFLHKKNKSIIFYYEKHGINNAKIREKLNVLSDGKITNFEGSN